MDLLDGIRSVLGVVRFTALLSSLELQIEDDEGGQRSRGDPDHLVDIGGDAAKIRRFVGIRDGRDIFSPPAAGEGRK